MTTELLMTIGFIFNDSDKEKRIVGGIESYNSTNNLDWLSFIGEKVMIKTSTNDLYFRVKKIDIFTSISGAINVGLTLDTEVQENAIDIGDEVYRIINTNDRIIEQN